MSHNATNRQDKLKPAEGKVHLVCRVNTKREREREIARENTRIPHLCGDYKEGIEMDKCIR